MLEIQKATGSLGSSSNVKWKRAAETCPALGITVYVTKSCCKEKLLFAFIKCNWLEFVRHGQVTGKGVICEFFSVSR